MKDAAFELEYPTDSFILLGKNENVCDEQIFPVTTK